MAFNTGNAVGSTDPRDLSDNAENLDRFANGTNAAYDDRLGVSRKSLAGMESDFATDQSERATTFANFLASSGYVGTGTGGAIEDYAGGIEITEYNQLIRESGEFYRAKASLSLPYTTTGTWVGDDETRFVSVGDAALRQEIGSGIFRADSLANLESTNGRFDGDAARLVSGTGRDGDFRWDSSDLSATLVLASATSDSVDDTTDTINDADHPFSDGDGVITQTTANGLTAQTVYWVVNSTSGTYQLSATFGGGAIDLTGTTNVTIDHLLDPLQGVYVTASGDPTGLAGAWVRSYQQNINAEWFGFSETASGLSNANAINSIMTFIRPASVIDYGRQSIIFPSGDYDCDSVLFESIRGITLKGGDSFYGTVIRFTGSGKLFEFDEFQSSPANYYYGTCFGISIENITFRDDRTIDAADVGTRTTTALEFNGVHDIELKSVKCLGFKYGAAFTSGAYYTYIKSDCSFQRCDVGLYIGPGSQIVHAEENHFALCGESVVVEMARMSSITKSDFGEPNIADIVFEGRNISRFGLDTTALGQKYELNFDLANNWHETGLAGQSWDMSRHIYVNGIDQPVRNVNVIKPMIISGTAGMAPKDGGTIYSFIEVNNGSFFTLEYPVISNGRLDTFVNLVTAARFVFLGRREVSGFSALTKFSGLLGSARYIDAELNETEAQGSDLDVDFIETSTNHKIRLSPKPNGQLGFAFNTAGTWFERVLFDMNASKISLGSASIQAASGSPEGVRTANVGSIYMRTDGGAGTTFYVKESGTGNTGWVAK